MLTTEKCAEKKCGPAHWAGMAGALVCLAAGVVRLAGISHLGGFETLSFFILGMALMLLSCMLKLS